MPITEQKSDEIFNKLLPKFSDHEKANQLKKNLFEFLENKDISALTKENIVNVLTKDDPYLKNSINRFEGLNHFSVVDNLEKTIKTDREYQEEQERLRKEEETAQKAREDEIRRIEEKERVQKILDKKKRNDDINEMVQNEIHTRKIDPSNPAFRDEIKKIKEDVIQTYDQQKIYKDQEEERKESILKEKQAVKEKKAENALKAFQQENLKKSIQGMTPEEIQGIESKISAGDVTETQQYPKWYQEALRGLLKSGVRQYADPYEPYLGERIAEESPLQIQARRQILSLNPFIGETRRDQEEIKDKIRNLPAEKSLNEVKSYLGEPNETLDDIYNRTLKPHEDDILSILERRSGENWRENILPSIEKRFAVPGLHQHGMRNTLIERANRTRERELQDAQKSALVQMRMSSLPLAQQYADLQARKGQIAGNAAISDLQNNMASIDALQRAQDKSYASKDRYLDTLNRFGEAEQARSQQGRDLAYEQFKEERDHGKTNLERFSNLIRGHNNIPTATTRTTDLSPKMLTSPYSTAGELIAGQGARMMAQRPFKKGGRVKKAVGGQINPMQEAINLAVIDKESPLAELNRNMRRQRAMGLMNELKNQRQKYAVGGEISPIEKGAMTAENMAYMDKVKKSRQRALDYAQRQQIPEERPFLTDAVRGMARAGARSTSQPGYSDNWLQRISRSMAGSFDDVDAERKAFKDQEEKGIERELGLLKDEEAIGRDERDFAFKEKSHAEKMALDKMLANATIQHHKAQEAHWNAKANEQKPMSVSEQKDLETTLEQIDTLRELMKQNRLAKARYKNLQTGESIGRAHKSILGSYGASAGSLFSKEKSSSPEDYQNAAGFTKHLGSLVKKVNSFNQKGRSTNFQLGIDLDKLPSTDLPKDTNDNSFQMIEESGARSLFSGVLKSLKKERNDEARDLIVKRAGLTKEQLAHYMEDPDGAIKLYEESGQDSPQVNVNRSTSSLSSDEKIKLRDYYIAQRNQKTQAGAPY